ncbi:MAG: histidine kinase dimerization/phosphoacceptor domain -containing protein [Anaerolineaceae bacterium]|nr:histidine kinase dimerization/phosphoacceptor domain -containing protein [Anaerolineaceae bacterium]
MPILNQTTHVLFILASFLSIVSGNKYFQYRTPMARWGGLFSLCLALELLSFSFQFLAGFSSFGSFWYFIQTLSFYCLPVFWLLLNIEITGLSQRVKPRIILLILCMPAAVLLIKLLQVLPRLTFSTVSLWIASYNRLPEIIGSFGIFIISIFYATGLLSILFLLRLWLNTNSTTRKLVSPMLLGTVLIVVLNILDQNGFNPYTPVNLIQIGLAGASYFYFFVVVIWRFGGILPISRESVFEGMHDGALILDYYDRVVDVNSPARKIIGLNKKRVANQKLSAFWPLGARLIAEHPKDTFIEQEYDLSIEGQEFTFVINISQFIGLNDAPIGRLIILRNTTSRERMEKALNERAQELQRTNTFLAALAEVNVNLQTATNPSQIYMILGAELKKLGMSCFISQLDPETNDLVICYLSVLPELITRIEKIIRGIVVTGYRLDKDQFSILYKILESKEISFKKYSPDVLGSGPHMIPVSILEQAIRLVGVEIDMPSLVLPLVTAERTVGLMGVWGGGFREADIPPFRIFGNQVAHVIERAILYEAEIQRSTELARSNGLIIALSKVASVLGTTSNSELVLDTLGQELNKVGLNCAVVTFDETVETAFIKYLSLNPKVISTVEKMTGLQLKNFAIPKRYWPGDRIYTEKNPIWNPNAYDYLRKMFPMVPEGVGKKFLPSLGLGDDCPLCILPLRIGDQVIGAMPIWGSKLRPNDSPILSVFGSQVAGIIRNVANYENEVQRKDELAHSNAMIMALSKVAAQLDTTTNIGQVYDTLGNELKKVRVSCLIGTLDDSQQMFKLEYLSVAAEVNTWMKKLGSIWPKEIIVARQFWPTDKAVVEKMPYWDPDPVGSAKIMFPFIPRQVVIKTFEAAGMKPDGSACYLPMMSEEIVIGLMVVWGPDLKNEDIHGLSVFANQVATAVRNTRLYDLAQKEIIERTQTEARIKEALNEKDVLLKEVHHRVKNNLQVISSLLNLQAAQISDSKTVDALQESQNRVRSMALIHEKLYQSNDLARIDFASYLQSLVASLAQTYHINSGKMAIEVHCEKISLNIDTAIPCGLIVNELVSNSFKYAFPADLSGSIIVTCQLTRDERYSLVVSDNGVGLPAQFDVTSSPSLGLKLVTSLVKQIEGNLIVEGKNGARYEILFAES